MNTFILYEVEGGFGYAIRNSESKVIIDQPFNPTLQGIIPMTESEATAFAQAELDEISATQS